MGRTIHYEIFGDLEEGPVPEDSRTRIIETQHAINSELTWTCESLALEVDTVCALTYESEPPRPWAPRMGWGFTKVGSDDWNAALVVRFLLWVSTQLPTKAFVRLHDEGDYVIPKYVIFRHGMIHLDNASVARKRTYLRTKAPEYLEKFDASIVDGCAGRWFRSVSILDYQDRPEIQKIRSRVGSTRFHEMTIDDAVDQIVFPWARARVIAA